MTLYRVTCFHPESGTEAVEMAADSFSVEDGVLVLLLRPLSLFVGPGGYSEVSPPIETTAFAPGRWYRIETVSVAAPSMPDDLRASVLSEALLALRSMNVPQGWTVHATPETVYARALFDSIHILEGLSR